MNFSMRSFLVEPKDAGKRLDAFLASKNQDISRMAVQRMIENGNIMVNGQKSKASYKVCEGDNIILEEVKPKDISLKAQDIPIEIIYEDKDIIVVNKPKGMVVHPGNGNPEGTCGGMAGESGMYRGGRFVGRRAFGRFVEHLGRR